MRISDWSSDVCSSDLNVDAQHLGDHTDRKQRGKFPDEIELALAAMLPDDIIDQFMRDTADAVLHCPDPAGHERFVRQLADADMRSEEHTSELQSLMRISYAVFCLNKKNNTSTHT